MQTAYNYMHLQCAQHINYDSIHSISKCGAIILKQLVIDNVSLCRSIKYLVIPCTTYKCSLKVHYAGFTTNDAKHLSCWYQIPCMLLDVHCGYLKYPHS